MAGTFPSELSTLQAAAGNPVDLKRIQDQYTRQSLEEVRSLMHNSHLAITRLEQTVDRRTSVLSPTKGFSLTFLPAFGSIVARQYSTTVDIFKLVKTQSSARFSSKYVTF